MQLPLFQIPNIISFSFSRICLFYFSREIFKDFLDFFSLEFVMRHTDSFGKQLKSHFFDSRHLHLFQRMEWNEKFTLTTST